LQESSSASSLLVGPDELPALIRRAKGGDRAAFEKLYNLYHKRVWGLIAHFVKPYEVAEELFQDTWMKAWEALPNTDDNLCQTFKRLV
jgi:DNA-directed RNA polymerase specialized sigma24 family protein